MTRRSLVRELAPPAPPCFADRLGWLEYLQAAFHTQRPGQPRVLLVELGQPVRINPDYPFCADCSAAHQASMEAAGRCWPWWLVDMQAAQPAPEYATS